MKIVFIQPNVGFKGHTWEALGIGYLISYLKKYYEKKLDIAFYSAFYDSEETIINACRDANIVCFTCTSPQYKHGLLLAKQVKKKTNLIVFGGPHPSALPDLVLKDNSIDVVVKGEGEKAILKIVEDTSKGLNISKQIYQFDYIKDIDNIPYPDRKAIKNERNIEPYA